MVYMIAEPCIGCGLCEPVCPVRAIFAEATLPQAWEAYVANSRQFFIEHPRVQPAQGRGKT